MTALCAGQQLDLLGDTALNSPVDEPTMRAWPPTHDVDADVIRDLLRGVDPGARPDPRGLRLRGVRVRGRLDLDLIATPVLLELQDCLLDHGISVAQSHLPMLALVGCHITHPDQTALDADRLRVDGSLHLNRSTISGTTADGTIRLIDAHIGGTLHLSSTTVHNTTGPAIVAEGLHIERDLIADGTCTLSGTGIRGTVILLDAEIGQALYARDATIRNASGPALHAGGARIGSDLVLDGRFTASGSGRERPVVHLPDLHVNGRITIATGQIHHDDPARRWFLDGLTYTGVPQLEPDDSRDALIGLLSRATPHYAAQPYQQLAAAYRAQGHDADARAVLIAQRRDQLARGDMARTDRWWTRLTGIVLGYGYQPWRALLYLLGVVAVSITLAVIFGANGALAVPGSIPRPCTIVETVGRGLDLGLPFLPRNPSSRCDIADNSAGATLTIATWTLQVIGWALAALFVAGFTAIVRKP